MVKKTTLSVDSSEASGLISPCPNFTEGSSANKLSEGLDSSKWLIKDREILPQIKRPSQVADLSLKELKVLAEEIRSKMISTVSKNGGHLAPSLGVVELTLAMLSVFNPDDDKIVWDVGHQSYAYKLLTGRAEQFDSLRQFGGISGFPNMAESSYDHFGTGHSSTSVSAALGMAMARDIAGQKHHVVSVIGDGSFTAGLAYEGFNQAGAMGRPFIVILNDNEMSISRNVGALSLFMSRNLSSRWVRVVKKEIKSFLKTIPAIGDDLYEIAKRSKHSFKNFFTPGILFEALQFNYIGAVDGHNIEELQNVLRLASTLDKPVLVHVLTKKGKGYEPAENNPTRFHGVGSFCKETGEIVVSQDNSLSYTQIFGNTICKYAEKDDKIVAITAAMPEGTGLAKFAKDYPNRFFDVGICEQHAVTFAAGLATQGFKPFVCVYSTFLQRAYDQIIHDVCLQNLPVVFCVDRAGLVGEDGASHHGTFDLSYLRHIPNISIVSPSDGAELEHCVELALKSNKPFAIRYPRGSAVLDITNKFGLQCSDNFDLDGRFLSIGNSKCAVVSLGRCVHSVCVAAQEIKKTFGLDITVFDARWVKPLPINGLKKIIDSHDKVIIVEENVLNGGFSSAISEYLLDKNLLNGKEILRVGLPDSFVPHGSIKVLNEQMGLDVDGLKKAMCKFFCLA